MDLHKAKVFLDKLNREFARMSKDPDNIARIDLDIMASYVRDLYDAVLSEPVAARPEKKPAISSVRFTEEVVAPPPPKVETPPMPKVEAPPPPPPPPPVEEEKPEPPVVVAEKPQPPVVEEVKPAPKPAPRPAASAGEFDTLFEEKLAKELSEKLSEMPIADLKKAIALNDRLLLTRELFAGDGQAFENTIQTLNGYSDFNDAKAYLIDNCITRYMWLDKKRVEDAKNFIKLVRRRYK